MCQFWFWLEERQHEDPTELGKLTVPLGKKNSSDPMRPPRLHTGASSQQVPAELRAHGAQQPQWMPRALNRCPSSPSANPAPRLAGCISGGCTSQTPLPNTPPKPNPPPGEEHSALNRKKTIEKVLVGCNSHCHGPIYAVFMQSPHLKRQGSFQKDPGQRGLCPWPHSSWGRHRLRSTDFSHPSRSRTWRGPAPAVRQVIC